MEKRRSSVKKIEKQMKSDQNSPPATRTITTSTHQTSQDEPPIKETRRKKKTNTKLQSLVKTLRKTATPGSTEGTKFNSPNGYEKSTFTGTHHGGTKNTP
jgi:hypothetical protein